MSSILKLFREYPVLRFGAGEVVIEQGAEIECLYFLIEGEVEILKNKTQVATASQPGIVFGEMAVLLGSKSVTTLRTLKSCAFTGWRNRASSSNHHRKPACISVICWLAAWIR